MNAGELISCYEGKSDDHGAGLERIMESRDEAIAYLIGRGFHAQTWDWHGEEALGVASEAVETSGYGEEPITILRHLVVVVPVRNTWVVFSEIPGEDAFPSLKEAVEFAAVRVLQLRGGGPFTEEVRQ